MLVMIDNYDSFTYNLVQYLGELGAEVVVHRNDQITPEEIESLRPEKLMISPGPCTPDQAGISVAAVEHFAERLPILGVCLGHQSIGQAYGASIVHAKVLMHGKTSKVYHAGKGLFAGLEQPFVATRYHSLVIEPESLPQCFEVSAWTEDDEIMGIQHVDLPLYGVQFHPESIATQHGHELLQNFLSVKH